MPNGHKLSGSGSNQSQPKIFPPGTGSSDSSSALTVENVKRLEQGYMISQKEFNRQRIQDYINQTNLLLFSKDTTKKTSTEFFWDEDSEGASSHSPAKWSESSKEVCCKTSEDISMKDKLLTAPATDSPSPQPAGSKLKESKLFQLGKKEKSNSPATVNQHSPTLHTTDTAAARPIYISRGCSSVFSALQYKR